MKQPLDRVYSTQTFLFWPQGNMCHIASSSWPGYAMKTLESCGTTFRTLSADMVTEPACSKQHCLAHLQQILRDRFRLTWGVFRRVIQCLEVQKWRQKPSRIRMTGSPAIETMEPREVAPTIRLWLRLTDRLGARRSHTVADTSRGIGVEEVTVIVECWRRSYRCLNFCIVVMRKM
jgi:hypothetical protein